MATGRLPDPNTAPVTAKGDLYTYSTVPAKLAVGSNGETLVADSSQTTGLRYNPPVGSLANPVINGAFDIWQRGTSSTTTGAYVADRWWNGNSSAATYSRQTTGDTTNLPNIQYCLRMQRNSGATSTDGLNAVQSFETVNSIPFAGKAVTVSFYARKGANLSGRLEVYLESGTGTDQFYWTGYTGRAQVAITTITSSTLTTTWQRYVMTGTVPATATELAIQIYKESSGTAGAADFVEVTGVQLDIGTWTASTAPTFRRSGGTLAGELAACQRYYFRNTGGATYSVNGQTIGLSSTTATGMVYLPVQMRVKPTSVEYANLLVNEPGVTNLAITALTLDANDSGPNIANVSITTSAGLTASRAGRITNNNNTGGYLGFSAEL